MLVIPAFVLAEGERSIIQPDKTLLIVFVLFIVFVVVMNYLLFKPIGRILDERETLTDGAIPALTASDVLPPAHRLISGRSRTSSPQAWIPSSRDSGRIAHIGQK